MATLYAIVYPDAATAEQAEQTMRGLSDAGFLRILDSSLVTKSQDGKIEHRGERHSVRRGAVGGDVVRYSMPDSVIAALRRPRLDPAPRPFCRVQHVERERIAR